MSVFILYRIAAALLTLGLLGHTLGGMMGMARKGPGAGPEANQVLASMKAVHFKWRGADCTWYDFWMGNGLGVSALIILAIAVLWILGGAGSSGIQLLKPIAWAAFVSLALLAAVGFAYFPARIGAVFALIALLTGIANLLAA
jgi:hypothetical protein